MEKNRISFVYGYLVCLVSIIVGLVSVGMIIGAIFNLQDPLRANNYQYGDNVNLSSFEAYKIDILTGRGTVNSDGKSITDNSYKPTDTELRAAYDSSKDSHIANVKLDASRSITSGVLMIIVAGLLFFTHWRWLNRLGK